MNYIRAFFLIVLLLLIKGTASGQVHFDNIPKGDAGMKTGPEIGSKIPEFLLPDQNGKNHDFNSISGPKGALILFYRSADW